MRAQAATGEPAPQSAPTDAVLTRLTARVKALLSQRHGGDARSRVELGAAMHKVRARLEHGHWLGWLEETVPFTSRSALNYIELAIWAEATPEVFERVAPLGASKVYLLSKLSLAQVEQLLAKAEHTVPGTKRRTTLRLMSYPEFTKLILQRLRPASPPADPIVALLAEARSSTNRTKKHIGRLIASKRALEQEAVAALHDDLVAALQELSAAFKLD